MKRHRLDMRYGPLPEPPVDFDIGDTVVVDWRGEYVQAEVLDAGYRTEQVKVKFAPAKDGGPVRRETSRGKTEPSVIWLKAERVLDRVPTQEQRKAGRQQRFDSETAKVSRILQDMLMVGP